MRRLKATGAFKPFEGLKALLDDTPLLRAPPPAAPAKKDGADSDQDQRLFREAMADVVPLSDKNQLEKAPPAKAPYPGQQHCDADILRRLHDLIRSGEGFVVADTPEYIEGRGRRVNPILTARLHRGDFSIQATIDLHGLTLTAAREAFEGFMQDAVRTSKRTLLIIHGRGLSSPKTPVLKTNVERWLAVGYWRKWVATYASARLCDGGTGATYVLLRGRPLPKKRRRSPSRQ